MATKPKKKTDPSAERVEAIKHESARRKNIPPAGLEAQGRIPKASSIRYEYNPHLPPVLRWSSDPAAADRLPELLQTARERSLTEDEARLLGEALRKHEPWLEWSGKREKPWFEVDPVVLHIHERVSTQAILKVLAREDVQRGLFGDPQQSYADAVQFYKHDVAWTNRMILGDSLQVMASLARREDLAGKVQMIYLDPPYGVNFKSNFQPELGQRDVKDRAQDLTREPEMVRAYRDTWTLGVHSYLAYLRDRLYIARELLADAGSIFVQISQTNVHRLRAVLDEVFGAENAMPMIVFRKTTGAGSPTGYVEAVPQTYDLLLWYARDISKVKIQRVFIPRTIEDDTNLRWIESTTGERRTMSRAESERPELIPHQLRVFRPNPMTSQSSGDTTVFPVALYGRVLNPRKGGWKTNQDGMARLLGSERLLVSGDTLSFVRYLDDFPFRPVIDIWDDTRSSGFGEEKVYVVQTNTRVVERCLLMTTDCGDLVLDPTCGSGTTAFVAEQWGRRWITIDTSRVALALARQRLMTARYSACQLRDLSVDDLERNQSGTWLTDPTGRVKGKATFRCKTVPHITLKSIVRNASLDPIFERYSSTLDARLTDANGSLQQVTPEHRAKLADKLRDKQKREGKKSVTDADRRRWELPKTEWREWEMPFDTDPDWPQMLQKAVAAYRAAWRSKMDEVDAAIAVNAELEELLDKPEEIKGVVRVAGPFTMEGVIAVEQNPETLIAGAPEELETFGDSGAGDVAVANAEAYLDKIIRLLRSSGVDFANNKRRIFSRIEAVSGAGFLHAEGDWVNGDGTERRVAISIGPEVGNVSAGQVEEAIHASSRRGYDDLLIVGFGFDPVAQSIIDADPNPRVRSHMSLIRPDVAMDDLLKTQPGSQLFTVFSAPRVHPPEAQPDGQFVVEVEGMDVYDPVSNTLHPTNKDKIAAWFLDSDYDGRTFCITQAFFPDKSKWTKLAKALGDQGTIDESAFEALSGWRSLPFPRPCRLKEREPWRIAVKVIDPRGNEGLRVVEMHQGKE
ncbi:MAG TPA: site-specific DNA-methyltransferase [Thermoanaerobaculia bacterium]|jgi:adenine-specific DNA-methyltransferase|nr:site-specific DNA-methyltransferase [Thermoanaerobaculia bacterium]